MRTQELLKLLKKNECNLYRKGKKHDIWYSKTTKKQFSIPGHKTEIPLGTLYNILRDAGIR